MKTAVLSVALVGLSCAGAPEVSLDTPQQALRGAASERVFPPQASPHGRSYAEWAGDWWRWALAIPAAENPIVDETGEDCARGQQGPVWFLAGNFGGASTRSCVVPAGRALFFPLASVIWVQTVADPEMTLDRLRDIVHGQLAGVELSASIDGVPVVGLERYQEDSPVIAARLPDDNVLAVDETRCEREEGVLTCRPFLDTGVYLMVKPLPRGTHTLRFASYTPFFDTRIDVTYHLTID